MIALFSQAEKTMGNVHFQRTPKYNAQEFQNRSEQTTIRRGPSCCLRNVHVTSAKMSVTSLPLQQHGHVAKYLHPSWRFATVLCSQVHLLLHQEQLRLQLPLADCQHRHHTVLFMQTRVA